MAAKARGAAEPDRNPRARAGRKTRQERALSPNIVASYGAVVRGVIVPKFGSIRLDDASDRFLDAVLVELEQARSAGHPCTVLPQVFGHAVARGWLATNPKRNVSPPRRVHLWAAVRLVASRVSLRGHLRNSSCGLERLSKKAGGDHV